MIALHEQATSIDIQLRGMRHVKLQSRIADLEDAVFGGFRSQSRCRSDRLMAGGIEVVGAFLR
jgi:hypothetical protein